MKKWNLIFDVERCSSCNNCVLATKDEYLGNSFAGYSEPAPEHGDLWFDLKRHERGKAPMIDVSHYIDTCQQCDNPACITAQTADAISQREDGIVVIDPVAANGRKDLVEACPFGQIHWNEELQLPQKWSFDAHLLDSGWAEPRASRVCPTQALRCIKASDAEMQALIQQYQMQPLQSVEQVSGRIWCKNLDRIQTSFLGGTLVRRNNGLEDCAEGITVRLLQGGTVIAEQISDAYGDFKFDGLVGSGGEYEIAVVDNADQIVLSTQVVLADSTHIGCLEI